MIIEITAELTKRVLSSIKETENMVNKFENMKTFDNSQELEKQRNLSFYKAHKEKLNSFLKNGFIVVEA